MLNDRPLLIASENEETSRLATSLDAEFVSLPDLTRPETFEAWRAKTLKGDVRERVIVSVWPPPSEARDLVELDANAWVNRFEQPCCGISSWARRRNALPTGGVSSRFVRRRRRSMRPGLLQSLRSQTACSPLLGRSLRQRGREVSVRIW